jgi:hypothetical protein
MSNATRTTTLHRRLKNNIMNNPSCPLQLPDMNVAEIADERGGVVLVDLLLQHCYIYFLPIGPIYICICASNEICGLLSESWRTLTGIYMYACQWHVKIGNKC